MLKILLILIIPVHMLINMVNGNPLANTSWKLISIRDSTENQTYDFSNSKSVLRFTDSMLYVSGCNSIFTKYKSGSGKLKAEGIATTAINCFFPFSKIEKYISGYFFDLSYRVHADTLELFRNKEIAFKYLRD